ncbi:MPN domain-containing protein-like isoform X3 [Oratosquilla oratoria]|uniref:MPN domain-containing protein-like isoform X3 n=1 Tax=Oratosquilla oratoria TaxID=337810 RepID=UPI003F774196
MSSNRESRNAEGQLDSRQSLCSLEPASEDTHMEDEVEEIEEEEEEDDEDLGEDEEEEGAEITHGRSTGRGLTLKTLLKEGVLEPGEGHMTINYLGNKFKGDLLPDGRIKSQETSKIFGSPSAWAIYCKKIVNPDKKSGCGWASVRYRGRKLDEYKSNWYRQKRIEFEKEGEEMDEDDLSDSESDAHHEQEIVEFELIGNRHPNHSDMNTMVELTSFQSLGRMQPFNITMSSSAAAVMDIHAHLSTSEVVGYLAGQWDVNNHNLIVSHALPMRCRLGDAEKGQAVEQALFAQMDRLNLSLLGWYHTHPFSPPLPTLRDIDSQLDYEMKMKGSNDASYTPVVGIIISPYVRGSGSSNRVSLESSCGGFWVMPPPEHKPHEYGRPMSMTYSTVQDSFIPKDALLHIRDTIEYYADAPDAVVFTDIFHEKYTYWDKLKISLKAKVPKEHFEPLIEYLAKQLKIKEPYKIPERQNCNKAITITPITSKDISTPTKDPQEHSKPPLVDLEEISEKENRQEKEIRMQSPDIVFEPLPAPLLETQQNMQMKEPIIGLQMMNDKLQLGLLQQPHSETGRCSEELTEKDKTVATSLQELRELASHDSVYGSQEESQGSEEPPAKKRSIEIPVDTEMDTTVTDRLIEDKEEVCMITPEQPIQYHLPEPWPLPPPYNPEYQLEHDKEVVVNLQSNSTHPTQ